MGIFLSAPTCGSGNALSSAPEPLSGLSGAQVYEKLTKLCPDACMQALVCHVAAYAVRR